MLCGVVYIVEMQMLPEEIQREFIEGNFVVKVPDQRQEWINGIGKEILQLLVSNLGDTKSMYSINATKVTGYIETNISRKRKDTSDKNKVWEMLFNFGMFSDETKEKLTNLVTKH